MTCQTAALPLGTEATSAVLLHRLDCRAGQRVDVAALAEQIGATPYHVRRCLAGLAMAGLVEAHLAPRTGEIVSACSRRAGGPR